MASLRNYPVDISPGLPKCIVMSAQQSPLLSHPLHIVLDEMMDIAVPLVDVIADESETLQFPKNIDHSGQERAPPIARRVEAVEGLPAFQISGSVGPLPQHPRYRYGSCG